MQDSNVIQPNTLRGGSHYRTQHLINRVLLYLAVAIGLFVFMGPFIWSVLSSFKGPAEIYLFPPKVFPSELRWQNYAHVWETIPFALFYWNTIVITVLSLLGTLISSTLVAYGFARFEFRGRNILFMVVIATLILPDEVTLIPRFILFRELKWLDTFLPLIVPNFFGAAFFIFLLRQFFMTIPRELDEAAEIDGAGVLRTLWSILLPSLGPALATVAIFSFLFNWSSFIDPLIYLRSTENYTLSLGLRFFQQAPETGGDPQEPFLMAASLMVTLPPILLFIFAQRYFVRGVVLSGIKG